MRTTTLKLGALALLLAACGGKDGANSAAMAGDDPDIAQNGGGVPQGYVALTDNADAQISAASYSAAGNDWEVKTGPAHIVYAAGDSASGVYAVSTTIQQLEKPAHPEAYGVFFGGSNLDDRAAQQYGYFIVRGTGEYLIKSRQGDSVTTVVPWTASDNVPSEDEAGKASYDIKVHFAPDTAHFMVNDKLVAAVPRSEVPSAGVAGLRINHNLHLDVQPVTISK